jgi:hypothetical protein
VVQSEYPGDGGAAFFTVCLIAFLLGAAFAGGYFTGRNAPQSSPFLCASVESYPVAGSGERMQVIELLSPKGHRIQVTAVSEEALRETLTWLRLQAPGPARTGGSRGLDAPEAQD